MGKRVIAIDADSSPNLAQNLGLSESESAKIVPVADDTELIRLKTGTTYSGVFRLTFTVDDIIQTRTVTTPSGVNLMVMGTVHAVDAGCNCPAHAVVKALLRHLIVEKEEIVILDMEAGIEHLGRGTAGHVDLLIIVSDSNRKSLETAGSIHRLAGASEICRTGMIGNRVTGQRDENVIKNFAQQNGIPILTLVPFDQMITDAGITGNAPDPKNSPAVAILRELASALARSKNHPGI